MAQITQMTQMTQITQMTQSDRTQTDRTYSTRTNRTQTSRTLAIHRYLKWCNWRSIVSCALLPLLGLLPACQEQADGSLKPDQVPASVKTAFSAKYPTIDVTKAVQWEAQPYGYEAIFVQDGMEYEVEFSTTGAWLETEYEVAEPQFPASVLDRVRRENPGYAITKREIEITPNGTFYEVEIEQGDQEIELYFDDRANPARNSNEDA